MKKLMAVVAAVLVGTSSLFALGNSLDVNFAVPMLVQTYKSSVSGFGQSATSETTVFDLGFGLDVADTVKLTKKLGVKAAAGFYWPSKNEATTKVSASGAFSGSTEPKKVTTNYSDVYSSCFDFNLFAGLAYSPIAHKNGLTLTLTPGIDLNWFSAQVKNSSTTDTAFHFGVGADVAVSYAIKNHVYLTASCPLVYYFSETVNDKTNDNYKGAFGFTPKIGLGYYF